MCCLLWLPACLSYVAKLEEGKKKAANHTEDKERYFFPFPPKACVCVLMKVCFDCFGSLL